MNKIKSINTIGIMLVFCIIIGLISGIVIKKVNATGNKPNLNINLEQVTVNGQQTTNYNANVKDEIEFTYKVTPEDIAAEDINIPTQKEIVLVLDTSGSMDYDINTGNEKNQERINSLKRAAESFIDKFIGNGNVKIGVVPYSYYAGYRNEIKELMNVANKTDADNLKNYIDRIKVEGATNHGDGLRVAGRMLKDNNSNSAAKKYLIFLTDGDPTGITFTNDNLGAIPDLNLFAYAKDEWGKANPYKKDASVYTFVNGNKYTTNGYKYDYLNNPNQIDYRYYVKYRGWDYENHTYYNINLKQDFNGGNNLKYIDFNQNVLDDIPTKYAQTIGQKLKDDIPNFQASTIAYGTVESDGTSAISKVNESMEGTLYSAKDSNAIDKLFNSLADEILEDYTVSNVNLNLKLPDSLEFAADETKFKYDGSFQVASLDNIIYKLNSDKKIYVADPFYVTFKVKAKTYGIVNFGESSNISYNNINGQSINKPLLIPNINIVNNALPNINAYLNSPTPNTVVDPSEEIEVTYTIDPGEAFEYNASVISGAIDEAVFVVDETSKMNQGERYRNFKNGFDNRILDGNILGVRNIKFNVVGYNDSVNFPNSDDYNTLIGRISDREKLRLVFENQITSQITNSTSNNRNIEDALDRANKLLQEKGEQGKNKAIILVTSGDANYDSNSNIIKAISQNGYKIISLDLSNIDGSQNNNLKTLHQLLSGKDEDYILATADGGNYNTPEKNYAESIAYKLLGGTQSNTITIKGAKLNFDLGENFYAEVNSGLSGTGKVRSLNIPDITYTKNETSGKYVCQQDSKSLELKFKIKPTEEKKGKLGFTEDSETDSIQKLKNYISYNRLDGIATKKHIETPIINIPVPIPDINAYLNAPQLNAEVEDPSQSIEVEYEIKAEDFENNFGNSPDGMIDEAVFVVNLTNDQGNGNSNGNNKRWELMDPWFDTILLNDSYPGLNNLNGRNIKFGVIGYGYDERLFDRNITADKNALSSIVLSQPQWKLDIGQELAKADNLLQTKGSRTANKAIVIIDSNDNFSYTKEEVEAIKNKGYKIITLNMDWAPGQIKQSVLPELHQALGGNVDGDSDYRESDRYGNGNNKGSGEDDMTWIAGKLKSGITHKTTNDVKLNFDLGENFKQDTGLSMVSEKIGTLSINEPISYTLQYDNEKRKYLWHQTNTIIRTFTVKVADNAMGKYERLGFGSYINSDTKYSTISYTDFYGMPINKKIDTPIIHLKRGELPELF